ncbi:hypothetical protein [Promicromonospora iranensis]|uniref:hypothetical protein n=1 Tax=Promicromonospora iranensis TaxID=1105144 RepID=UPI0023A9E6B0|nr:hypothetical protein [Promicromonospora iranensis]
MATTSARTTTPKRHPRSLPPMPEELPLPATFGDWYDTAATNLGVAEKRDSGARRMLAGAVMLAGVSAGAGLVAGPVAVLSGDGAPGETADVASLVIGPVLALGVLVWWFWYRRDWARVRRLRHAWSRSIRDPRVLALPARPHQGQGPDPEEQHDFRARERAALAPYPGLRSVGGVTGGLDAVRAGLYPIVFLAGLVGILATLGSDTADGEVSRALPLVPLVVTALWATTRAWQRVADSSALVALQADDRRRWAGWRVVRGVDHPAPATPWYRRLNWAVLPIALGALAVLVFRVGAGEMTGQAVVIGLALCVVPAAVVSVSFLVRSLGARSQGGTNGVGVQVSADDVPSLGPVSVTPGQGVLRAAADGMALDAGGSTVPVPAGSALVSGEPHAFATRRHWILLPDGSQVPLTCGAVRPLRELAQGAGLRVL